jgi:hypothetical protein
MKMGKVGTKQKQVKSCEHLSRSGARTNCCEVWTGEFPTLLDAIHFDISRNHSHGIDEVLLRGSKTYIGC